MNRVRNIVVFFALLLAAPAVLLAAREGRLIGKVLDPEGQPIEGVTVIATAEQLPDFRKTETTDRRGVFKVDFPERHITYRLRFEKGGYQPFESEQEWRLEGTARQEFTMQTAQPIADVAAPVNASSEAIAAYNAGVAAFNARELKTAETRFLEALKHEPELSQAWTGLARVFLDLGQYQQAAEAAEKAIALGATDEAVWRVRWEAYRGLGNEEKAAAALLDLENASVRAEEAKRIYNEGVALTRAGDHAAAYAKFEQALAVDPNLQPAVVGLALAAVETGRHTEAIAAAEKILEGEPGNEQAVRLRFNAALALGDDEKLLDALVDLAPFEPQTARDGLLRLAFKVYDANEMEKAKERFLRVVRIDPDHALTHYFLGLINANVGNENEALTHLRRFLELDPKHTEAGSAKELIEYLKSN